MKTVQHDTLENFMQSYLNNDIANHCTKPFYYKKELTYRVLNSTGNTTEFHIYKDLINKKPMKTVQHDTLENFMQSYLNNDIANHCTKPFYYKNELTYRVLSSTGNTTEFHLYKDLTNL